jgi:hypothetical protein
MGSDRPSPERRRRSRSKDRHSGRSSYDKKRRSRSRSRDRYDRSQRHSRSPETRDEVDKKKIDRLAKLQAWKQQQKKEEQRQKNPQRPILNSTNDIVLESLKKAQEAAALLAAKSATAIGPSPSQPTKEEEDPLDAFMASEVLPEVAARQIEEKKKEEEEKAKLKELYAKGKTPKALQDLLQDEDDKDESPDMEIEVPSNKLKLVIGPGGEKIKWIEKRTKCRIQRTKDAATLEAGFGASGVQANLAAAIANAHAHSKGPIMVKLHLFGNQSQCEAAEQLIQAAIENKEEKEKQRQKQYGKKKDTRKRERQIYHLRHARDYEALGLPMGASKAECKAAYRRLALQWHPDKNIGNREEAEKKFQDISKAYESLMSTDEDKRVEQIGNGLF